jgi:hypothetical protein
MTPKTLDRSNSTKPEVMKNLKINVFLKEILGSIFLLSTFEQKKVFSAIFKPKSAGNRPF